MGKMLGWVERGKTPAQKGEKAGWVFYGVRVRGHDKCSPPPPSLFPEKNPPLLLSGLIFVSQPPVCQNGGRSCWKLGILLPNMCHKLLSLFNFSVFDINLGFVLFCGKKGFQCELNSPLLQKAPKKECAADLTHKYLRRYGNYTSHRPYSPLAKKTVLPNLIFPSKGKTARERKGLKRSELIEEKPWLGLVRKQIKFRFRFLK